MTDKSLHKYAVIVAGGSGSRMGGGMPKQFRSLCDRPVLWWSMKAFHLQDPDTEIILVLPADFITLWNEVFSSLPDSDRFPHKTVSGGNSRSESVKRGLSLVDNDSSLVAIHDGARPLIHPDIISQGWESAEKYGAAIPVVPVVDSLRYVSGGNQSEAVDRDSYKIVQTPQVFRTSILKEAYQFAGDKAFSDDATVVENAGHKIALFSGSTENIKITNPKDLAIACVLMGKDA
ncbi:MAG: 2-C-methyl-D-erythritol 4-phosphate cytidylyltransferase [Muribaculaceae bacterium]|nr:2-C-methyl-D-erythritol 4-phosphate cytidylyltransferase [Muribaculaceae bacterium]